MKALAKAVLFAGLAFVITATGPYAQDAAPESEPAPAPETSVAEEPTAEIEIGPIRDLGESPNQG